MTMNRDIWTISNKNFKIHLDACVDNNEISDKKFSITPGLWSDEIPYLEFSDSEIQKQYNNYVSDLIILFSEPLVDEILINARIGEESEYNQDGIHDAIIIRKIDQYIVDEIIK